MIAILFSLFASLSAGFVEVTHCESYPCPYRTYKVYGVDTSVMCPSKLGANDWFFKSPGIYKGMNLVEICKEKGFDGLWTDVYQAAPADQNPDSYTNPLDITCNSRYSSSESVDWVSEPTSKYATFKCTMAISRPVDCCNYANWNEQCVGTRNIKNNWVTCPYTTTCRDHCVPSYNTVNCWRCCYSAQGGKEWNCYEPTQQPTEEPTKEPTEPPTALTTEPTLEPTGTPTSAPSDTPTDTPTTSTPTGAPTVQPTLEPTSTPTTDAPSGTPTDAPSTSAPTDTPTRSPTETAEPTTAEPTDADTAEPTTAPTAMKKVTAELLCLSAKTKKDCKSAISKARGKCKFKSNKKGGSCKLKKFVQDVVCENLKKRDCMKAVKAGKCVLDDPKLKTCKKGSDAD